MLTATATPCCSCFSPAHSLFGCQCPCHHAFYTLPHESENPDSVYWQNQQRIALASRPIELCGHLWSDLANLLWPGDEFPTWKESATKINHAIQLWNAGERDLATIAQKVNQYASL